MKTGLGLLLFLVLSLGACAPGGAHAAEAEAHAEPILKEILEIRESILSTSREEAPVFLTFWDLDGTILAGDSSEGWKRDGKELYRGMIQRSIEAGFSDIYKGPIGFEEFWKDYQYMDERCGHWLSYPYLVQMLRGAKREDVEALARASFREEFRRWYFSSSMNIWRGLQRAGIECYVISAGAQVIVQGAAETLGIKGDHVHGIRVEERDGRLTERLEYPVTWAEGKAERIEQIVAEREAARGGQRVHVLAAFGNSYSTDGPFLQWTARRELPSGRKPVVVMINGGEEPEKYRGWFRRVTQERVVEGRR